MNAPERVLATLCVITLLAPVLVFAWLGVRLLFRTPPSERAVAAATGGALLLSLACAFGVAGGMAAYGLDRVVVRLGDWFAVGRYTFALTIVVDGLALPFVVLTCALTGVVGRFSASYLHRDPGFHRFYFLLLVFAAGMLLVVTAGSIDLLFAGWELVGLASALLIAFFSGRKEPVVNGLRAYATYRVCDVGLLVAAVLIHHYAHSPDLTADSLAGLGGGAAQLIGLLLVFAAMGKSAQVPFGGWLPRAMEGPTPSSAIFYGGLSIHAGAYLLLRAAPVLERSTVALVALVAVGSITAAYATLVGRAQTDAKNQLAYAAMAQVGLVFVEIGLGLYTLALVHIAGHATVRTLQFLRAPSLLHEFHQMHAAAGGHVAPTGGHYERLLPARVRRWIYSIALHRVALDSMLERFVVRPFLGLAGALEHAERRFVALFEPAPSGMRDESSDETPVAVAGEEGKQ